VSEAPFTNSRGSDWAAFRLAEPGQHADAPRSIHTREGVGDRLRAAAFAEIQARDAFLWAASTFTDAPEGLRVDWRGLASAEERHLQWLLRRLTELGFAPEDRKVSDQLWYSLTSCKTAENFAHFMATAEDRGRRAGERFFEQLRDRDPVSAEIFRKIAEEEIEHIRLAERYYPQPGGRTSSPPDHGAQDPCPAR